MRPRSAKAWTVAAYSVLAASILLVPHCAAKGYLWSESGDVVLAVIKVSLQPYRFLAPIFHVMTPLLVVAVALWGNRCRRLLAAYFAIDYGLIAVTQGIATTERFGFVVITGTVTAIALIAVLWVGEIVSPRNQTVFRRLQAWRYWVLPFAVLAFWTPSSKLEPVHLLTSDYGVAFCFTTPVVVSLLTLFYPNVNVRLLRVTAVVGLVIGLLNMYSWFNPRTPNIWLGILHLPLLLTSAYALVLTTTGRRTFRAVDLDRSRTTDQSALRAKT